MSLFLVSAASLLSLSRTASPSDSAGDDFFSAEFGAWIVCRKTVRGVDGYFGAGSAFSVSLQITNIGTQRAHSIQIEDDWDWGFVQRTSGESERIEFAANELAAGSTASFSYQLRPIAAGTAFPRRANISYFAGDEAEDFMATKIEGVSSIFIASGGSELGGNRHHDRLVVLSRSMFSRSTGSTLPHWILFVLFCAAAVLYPLAEYQGGGGRFDFVPLAMGRHVVRFCKAANHHIVRRAKQRIDGMRAQYKASAAKTD